MTMRARASKSGECGSALVEFVVGFSLFWTPLFLGTLVLGFNLIRAVQVTQVCRDAGHMYSQGIDFSNDVNPNPYQTLLIDLATGLNMTVSGGNGVIVLSTITYIGSSDCTSAGLHANSNSCPNLNYAVFTNQVVIGNSSLHASAFGTPSTSGMQTNGDIQSSTYLTNTADRATNFENVIPLAADQYAYVSEMWVTSPDISWWSFLGSTGASARSIF